jgi:hypothetical protein
MARATPLPTKTPFFSEPDIEQMAEVIKNQHGSYAAMIADFFAHEQAMLGDEVRAEAWGRVVTRLQYEGFERSTIC